MITTVDIWMENSTSHNKYICIVNIVMIKQPLKEMFKSKNNMSII
jgi:hypothetical protein